MLFFRGGKWDSLTHMRESLPNREWLLLVGFIAKERRVEAEAYKKAQRAAKRR